MRQWPPLNEGYSENFASLNRNKRSVVLDLKNLAHLTHARKLCSTADVIIENFRPGAMKRLGLGFDELKLLSPNLVYCSISAFGQAGPRAQQGGFDVSIQAIGGVMSVTGEPDGAPVKCGVPPERLRCRSICGFLHRLRVATGRKRTGWGSHRRAYARDNSRHRRASGQRIFRDGHRSEKAWLRASPQCAISSILLRRRVFRYGRRQQRSLPASM